MVSIELNMYSTTSTFDGEKYKKLDFRSDTVSIPSPEMRDAMAKAVVGDDVFGEDPTVNELERRSAELFGKEAALLTPSGTMANLLAIMVHCNTRGCEAISGNLTHSFKYEQGNAAQIAGVQLSTLENKPDGTFCLDELKQRIRGDDIHEPITKLVLVENTHNLCGGKVIPLDWLERLSNICRNNKLLIHMDGARILNAAEYLKVPVSEIVKHVDSVFYCMSKGLCCPIGSVLIGTKEFINQARRFRKVLGGGMRQAGIIAAAALYALNNILPNLGIVHAQVMQIAIAVHNLNSPNFKVDIGNVQTNILLIESTNVMITSATFIKRLGEIKDNEISSGITDEKGRGVGILMCARDTQTSRLVGYSQFTDNDINLSIQKIIFVIKEFDKIFVF